VIVQDLFQEIVVVQAVAISVWVVIHAIVATVIVAAAEVVVEVVAGRIQLINQITTINPLKLNKQ
jgi:hypothetical protein